MYLDVVVSHYLYLILPWITIKRIHIMLIMLASSYPIVCLFQVRQHSPPGTLMFSRMATTSLSRVFYITKEMIIILHLENSHVEYQAFTGFLLL